MAVAGWLYCLSNESMPGLFKICKTDKTPDLELKKANECEYTLPIFKLEIAKECGDINKKEKSIYDFLTSCGKRVNPDRTFFRTSLEEIRMIFDLIENSTVNSILDNSTPTDAFDSDEEVESKVVKSKVVIKPAIKPTIVKPTTAKPTSAVKPTAVKPVASVKSNPFVAKKRDMANCFTDTQRIRHYITSNDDMWIGEYNAARNAVLHNDVYYLSLSGFAKAHKISAGKSKSVNGWEECEYEVNGVWVSTATL